MMADFRLRKRDKQGEEAQVAVPETPPSLLGHVGSAVHTLGSLLSAPSRAVHGTINALTGGEGGFGNLNPLDATGGIEASHHLIRAGILPENDPTKWEFHDLTRGLVDMAGDPTTYLTPFGLTKAGMAAAKAGTLTKGVLPQIARGERALVTARLPFQGIVGHAGTGADVADTLATAGKVTRLTPVMQAVAGSKPVRVARGLFDSAMEGVTHPVLQKLMPGRYDKLQAAHKQIQETLVRIGRELQPLDEAARARGETFLPSHQVHSALEGVTTVGPELQRHVDELKGLFADRLAAEQSYGTGWRDALNDTAGIGYAPRYKSQLPGDKLVGGIGGSARVVKREDMLKGFAKGTHAAGGVNDVLQKLAKHALDPSLSGMTRQEKIEQLVNYLKTNHAADIEATYATRARNVTLQRDGGEWKRVTIDGKLKKFKVPKGFESALHGGKTKTVDINGVKTKVTIGGKTKRYSVGNQTETATAGGTRQTMKVGEQVTLKSVPRRVSRYRELAKYAIDNPDLAEHALFGNNPLADIGRALSGSYVREHNAKTVANAIAAGLQGPGAGGVKLRQLMRGKESLKYRDEMLDQIAHRTGMDISTPEGRDLLLSHSVDPELAKELQFVKPRKEMTAAGEQGSNWWQQALGLFKSGVLAFPASRVRDLGSGYVQNLLHGWGMPGSGAYTDAARVMNGQIVKGDYSHVKPIQDWLKKTGRANTPENQTEALRQLFAVHLPREHGFMGDLPAGQTGFSLDDVLRNVPGKKPTTTFRQFIADPLEAMRTLNPQSWNPLNVRGVGGRTETGFAPVKASEKFSEASDVLNRGAGFLDQLRKGTNVDVAARNVNRAQIDYNPATFSGLEKVIKRNVAPFYSFTSRIVPETARQIADLGSPTSQLLKGQTRAFGGNPAVPDYVLDTSGVPVQRRPDGTLQYLTGLGLMHEPATRILGQAATLDARGLALNTLAQLNPFLSHPVEQAAGVSFARDAEPTANLESNSGRLLSNMAVLAGLRHPDAGPVQYAGQKALDFAAGVTPVDRLLSTARQLTDTRRGIGGLMMQQDPITAGQLGQELLAGLGPSVSGVRLTDISPQKQLVTLRKRAEELASEAGAKERKDVYFSKAQLDRLREANPELAAKQEELQALLKSLKGGRQVKQQADSSKGFRLKKREKTEQGA